MFGRQRGRMMANDRWQPIFTSTSRVREGGKPYVSELGELIRAGQDLEDIVAGQNFTDSVAGEPARAALIRWRNAADAVMRKNVRLSYSEPKIINIDDMSGTGCIRCHVALTDKNQWMFTDRKRHDFGPMCKTCAEKMRIDEQEEMDRETDAAQVVRANP